MKIPETVDHPLARVVYEQAASLRVAIKEIAEKAAQIRNKATNFAQSGICPDEAGENAELAYRHLEDASMRLGKVLQHLDGGVSVYDRESTVGA